MRAAAVKYGGVQQRVSAQMSRAQALRLKSLAEEANQPEPYANDLTPDEAARICGEVSAGISTPSFTTEMREAAMPQLMRLCATARLFGRKRVTAR